MRDKNIRSKKKKKQQQNKTKNKKSKTWGKNDKPNNLLKDRLLSQYGSGYI